MTRDLEHFETDVAYGIKRLFKEKSRVETAEGAMILKSPPCALPSSFFPLVITTTRLCVIVCRALSRLFTHSPPDHPTQSR